MDLLDFIPFKTEFNKATFGLTTNASHTSENPLFGELKVRRIDRPAEEIAEFIVTKIDHWVGWNLKSEKTAVGGMTAIQALVNSFLLFGMTIEVNFGLLEEKDINGRLITTVNAKAVTNIESKGDLGESRRVIRMMLGALDFEFRGLAIKDEDYRYRSLDPQGSAAAFQKIFNEARIQHEKKPQGVSKATAIEFKKKPAPQTILLKKSTAPSPSPGVDADPSPAAQNGSAPTPEEPKSSKPKVMIISMKKPL
ncbi:MAG: hypothetical protein WCH05_04390 [Chlorobiaceae bacterium]